MICNQYSLPSNGPFLIGFAGAPSSGKDKMAEALSACLVNSSEKVPEEARKYIQENGPLYSVFQQSIIYHRQKELEDEILRNYQIAVSASPLFLAHFYAVLLKSDTHSSAEISLISDLYARAIESLDRYDRIFVCEPLSRYDQDKIRYQSDRQVDILHRSIISFLDLHGKPYKLLPALPIDKRLEIALDHLAALKK